MRRLRLALGRMTSSANPWQIQVQGAVRDLEHLARHFTTLPRVFRRDEEGPGFLYESTVFAGCTTSDEVLDAANRELSILSGVLKLVQGSSEPLRGGGVYRLNAAGGRDAFLRVHDAVHAHIADEVTLAVTDANGNVVVTQRPPQRTVRLANLAFSDGAVAKALRLIAQAESGSWVGLYRLYELVEADVGGTTVLIRHGWTTARALKEFKHSANSVAVAGDAARHGKETGAPPRNPMSLAEAAAYVGYILEAWLAYKGT